MKLVKGSYNEAKIFTDVADESAVQQVRDLCDTDFLEGTKIRMMPDLHMGKGCTIGTTILLKDNVVPEHVGVDIGCGISHIELDETEMDFAKLDSVIREKIPTGSYNYIEPRYSFSHSLDDFLCKEKLSKEKIDRGLGTLGGGNHFIEVSRNEKGRLVLTIHTGSRYLGGAVAGYYQKLANTKNKKNDIDAVVEQLKSEGRHKEIEGALNTLRQENLQYKGVNMYLNGQEKDDYLHDLGLAQQYARENRENIANTILKELDISVISSFDTIHNYIDLDRNILRKGAVSANSGELLIIPINMRDGSIIARGKGNEDWNYSAPHGAGRVLSRRKAKENLDFQEFQQSMNGIWTTSVVEETLDEAPGAYKKIEDILGNIGDTVDVLEVIKPVYNFKGIEEPFWLKNKKKK